jgi:hypothetical protein
MRALAIKRNPIQEAVSSRQPKSIAKPIQNDARLKQNRPLIEPSRLWMDTYETLRRGLYITTHTA